MPDESTKAPTHPSAHLLDEIPLAPRPSLFERKETIRAAVDVIDKMAAAQAALNASDPFTAKETAMPVTAHRINEFNKRITITHNPAGNRYQLYLDDAREHRLQIRFQHGPVSDGANGFTDEALLAIVLDRLKRFQAGPFSCRENEAAIDDLEMALARLADRTVRRNAKGIEGTHKIDPESEGALPGTAVPVPTPADLGAALVSAMRKMPNTLVTEERLDVDGNVLGYSGKVADPVRDLPAFDDKTPVEVVKPFHHENIDPKKSATKELADYLSARSKAHGGKKPSGKKD